MRAPFLKQVLPVILLVLCVQAYADQAPRTIRLQTEVRFDLDGEVLSCDITLRNAGTETAHRLIWQAIFAGESQAFWQQPQGPLPPGRSITVRQPLKTAAPLPPGEYPLVLYTDYRDTSGYPFSAILATTITNNLPSDIAPVPLQIRLHAPAELRKTSALRLVAVSSHDQPVRLRARLVMPPQIDSHDKEMVLDVPAGVARSIGFPIRNLNARAGSRLTVAVIVTGEIDQTPRCVISSTSVAIPLHRGLTARHTPYWIALTVILLGVFASAQWPRASRMLPPIQTGGRGLGLIIWGAILLLLSAYIPLQLLLSDTLTVGGDTPAHNYLASHLRDMWWAHGRILTWSHAWWSGFPVFQYYFPMPYILIALLDTLLPFNIAFKTVSVLGILLLPGCVYLAGRIMRFPPPATALMTVIVLPFLFTDAHVMWGVNLYSTLAGMIANSFSFAIFPLGIALAWRDAEDGRCRPVTPLLLAILMLSHFFTSIVAVITIAAMPLMRPRAGMGKAFWALLADGVMAALLAAWWLIPLLTKQAYSVDFGDDWPVSLWSTLPVAVWPAILPAGIAIVVAWRRRNGAILAWLWMTLASVGLFTAGTALHPVFVNVRLWPFVYFGILSLAAIGAGIWLAQRRYPAAAVMAVFLVIAIRIDTRPSLVRTWAEWNLEGLEAKPLAQTFRQIIEPLDGTPGRLAYDLNEVNKVFGSSRIFEVVPHLIDKPIIEGGLVNSALGALFAYTVQGEISALSAGYPTIVPRSEFNPALGTLHLELFNVRHLITAWDPLVEQLTAETAWRTAYRVEDWSVLEATAPDQGMIGVLTDVPDAVAVDDFQNAAVAWMQAPALLNRPLIWLTRGRTAPPESLTMTPQEFRAMIEQASAAPQAVELFDFDSGPVSVEEWSNHRIRFRTTAVGRPHLIKVSFFPNWKVSGAAEIHMVSPAFMLVIPNRPEVELLYGHTVPDRIGQAATILGLLALAACAWRQLKPVKKARPCR